MRPEELLQRAVNNDDALSLREARDLMTALLQGRLSEAQMAALLTALHHRGETAAELAGFADAMRTASMNLPLTNAEREELVDTCGTGGDGSDTFNISTAVALVACAAGVKIAKHGNRAVTSRCGSADVLEALGVRTDHTPETAVESLRRDGFTFLLATRMHPAMKIVAPVRRLLPFRTVFNLLGPMTNPAGARRQIIGAYSNTVAERVANALAIGGHMTRVLVVHGSGLDELSLAGTTSIYDVRGASIQHVEVTAVRAGLQPSNDPLTGGSINENAAILQDIFKGKRGPRRDIVVLNAAAVLVTASLSNDLWEGAKRAAEAIDSGEVRRLLTRLQRA